MNTMKKKIFYVMVCFVMAIMTMVACVACQPAQSSGSPNTSNSGTSGNGDSNGSGDVSGPVEFKIEAESAYTDSTANTSKWNQAKSRTETGASGGKSFLLQEYTGQTTTTDYYDFVLNVEQAGTYTVSFVSFDKPNGMTVRFQIDEVNVGQNVDLYHTVSSGEFRTHEIGTVTLTQAKPLAGRVYYVGRNSAMASSQWGCAIFDYFTLDNGSGTPIKIEAETAFEATGKWNQTVAKADATASGEALFLLQEYKGATTTAAYITFKLNVGQAGTYKLSFVSFDAQNGMTVQFKMNDVDVGEELDMYNGGDAEYRTHEVGTVTLTQAGDFTIQVYYVGRNASMPSSDWACIKFDYFTLTKI